MAALQTLLGYLEAPGSSISHTNSAAQLFDEINPSLWTALRYLIKIKDFENKALDLLNKEAGKRRVQSVTTYKPKPNGAVSSNLKEAIDKNTPESSLWRKWYIRAEYRYKPVAILSIIRNDKNEGNRTPKKPVEDDKSKQNLGQNVQEDTSRPNKVRKLVEGDKSEQNIGEDVQEDRSKPKSPFEEEFELLPDFIQRVLFCRLDKVDAPEKMQAWFEKEQKEQNKLKEGGGVNEASPSRDIQSSNSTPSTSIQPSNPTLSTIMQNILVALEGSKAECSLKTLQTWVAPRMGNICVGVKVDNLTVRVDTYPRRSGVKQVFHGLLARKLVKRAQAPRETPAFELRPALLPTILNELEEDGEDGEELSLTFFYCQGFATASLLPDYSVTMVASSYSEFVRQVIWK